MVRRRHISISRILAPEKSSVTIPRPGKSPARGGAGTGGWFFLLAVVVVGAAVLTRIASGIPTVKEENLTIAKKGLAHLFEAALALDEKKFDEAKQEFANAETNFSEVERAAWFAELTFVFRHPVSLLASINGIISSGKEIARAGADVAEGLKKVDAASQNFIRANKTSAQNGESISEAIASSGEDLQKALKTLAQAQSHLDRVNPESLPTGMRGEFQSVRRLIANAIHAGQKIIEQMPALLTLLGHTEPHTYLVLLQNNAELRPTGGFIGSFIIAEMNDGYLTKREFFDVYESDHRLAEIIAPPPEIAPVNPRWFLRDSNYSAHFPLSAKAAAQFLEKSGGPGVDTILALDATFVQEAFKLTGPISVSSLRNALTAENFSAVLSYIIESKLSGREDPKALLKELMPAFQTALFEKAAGGGLAKLITVSIAGKHLQGYSKTPAVQSLFIERGMAGLMKTPPKDEDYLAVAHTSIGGNKSDQFIKEKIIHDSFLSADGEIVDELTLSRSHMWTFATERGVRELLSSFGWSSISKNVIEIMGRSRNLQMLRIYVPKGSQIVESSGFPVELKFDPETDLSFFSTTMETGVGDTRTLKIRYKLPFRLAFQDGPMRFALQFQSQAGQSAVQLEKRIFPAKGVYPIKSDSQGVYELDGSWKFENDLEGDVKLLTGWRR